MYYIKCGVNSSLHNSGCCVRSVAPWITVLSRHTVFTKRVMYYKFTSVQYFTKQGTTPRPTSHLVHCVPLLWLWEEHSSTDGLVISLAIVFCCDFCWGLLLLLLLFLFFLLKIVFHIFSLHTWFAKLVSATRISLLSSSSSFIYFFQPLLSTHNLLPYLDYYVWLGAVAEM
jgi:hypothetical protein